MRVTKTVTKSISFPPWSVPITLLLLGLLAYGVMLPQWGFYWDDWAKISVPRLFGSDGYQAYYAEDRPLSAWTHLVFNAVLGESALSWQIFQFLLVLATTLAVYRLLLALWPQMRWQTAAAGLIFLVHPAFLQHAPAVTFHQQWLQYLFIVLSLWATLQVIRRPRWFWPATGLALLLSAIQLTVTEYFVPLELLRPVLIWIALGQAAGAAQLSARQRIKQGFARAAKAAWLTAPSLALLAGYVIYRLFFLQLSGEDPYRAETLYGLFSSPIDTLKNLAVVVVQDSAFVMVSAWTRFLVTGPASDLTRFSALTIGAGLLAGGAAAFYLCRLCSPQTDSAQRARWYGEAALFGLAAFILGVLPAWITGREVVFDFHSDRYALPALLGASLLMVMLSDWLAGSRVKCILLVSLLIGIGTEAQLRSAKEYADIWNQQRAFYWQLYWRAPFISPGTALVTMYEAFPNQGLFSSSAALNLLYPQKQDRDYLAYWWYALSPRYTVENLPDPHTIRFNAKFRNLAFQGSSRRALVAYKEPNQTNCLWIVSAADQDEAVLSPLVAEAAPMTDLNLIKPIAPEANWSPPTSLFGPEPDHGWCYYFEKGDLEAQEQHWAAAAALGDEARQKGYHPTHPDSDAPREWQPFIRAYSQLSRWDEAVALTLQSFEVQPEDRNALCGLWEELNATTRFSVEKSGAVSQVNNTLACRQISADPR